MLKKSFLTVAFLLTVMILSGCNNAPQNETANEAEKVDYIVTTVIPTSAREGVKDETVGFIKINPNFDAGTIPAQKEKIKWFNKGLGAQIPAFDEGNILEVINTDDAFLVYIANVDEQMFGDYFSKLAANGYEFSKENQNWENFNMHNDKYAVNMRFGQDGPNVTTIRAKKAVAQNVEKQAENAEEAADKE